MAKLYFRYGTMDSAKSMNLLAVAHNYRKQGKRVLLLKPKLDDRFGSTKIASRYPPDAPSDAELNVMLQSLTRLGRVSQSKRGVRLTAHHAATVPDGEKKENHLILIGLKDSNKLFGEFDGRFNLLMSGNTADLRGTNEKLAEFRYGPEQGIMEEIISPWNASRVALALTALTRCLVINALNLVTSKPRLLRGDQRRHWIAVENNWLATRYGAAAVRLAAKGKFDRMVALHAGDIVDVSLEEAVAVPKRVDIHGDAVVTARGMSISFGDE